jgi:hypothetical protein
MAFVELKINYFFAQVKMGGMHHGFLESINEFYY